MSVLGEFPDVFTIVTNDQDNTIFVPQCIKTLMYKEDIDAGKTYIFMYSYCSFDVSVNN